VFGIQMIGDTGFLCGQDGMIMRSHDSGLTWQKLDSRTHLFIFALSFPDKDHGFLVGDRSLVLSTTNGGDTFTKRQLQRIFPVDQQDYALPYEEPLLYGVSFVNDDQGWVVGEFGRIWATDNGGQTWTEQQDSLLPQWKRPLNPSDDPRFADFNLPTMFGVSFRDAQHGYAAGLEGSVVATDDGGKTWHFQQQAERPGAPPDAFQPGERAAGPRDPLFAIQVFGNDQGMTVGLTGSALRLQPNGVWAHDASLPALPFGLNQVRFFDDQHGWIVGYGVVLYTDDGGKTWRFCQG